MCYKAELAVFCYVNDSETNTRNDWLFNLFRAYRLIPRKLTANLELLIVAPDLTLFEKSGLISLKVHAIFWRPPRRRERLRAWFYSTCFIWPRIDEHAIPTRRVRVQLWCVESMSQHRSSFTTWTRECGCRLSQFRGQLRGPNDSESDCHRHTDE